MTIKDYITFARTFENYKWYKPLLVFIISFVIMFILVGILTTVVYQILGIENLISTFGKGIESLNNPETIIFTDLCLFMFIPSLYIASKIVNDRPFSSYSSSRGGWNFKLYLKALIIPLILYLIYFVVESIVFGKKASINFSIAFIIAIFITVPLQCIAEEYMFRGLILQTLGSWIKIPLLAVVLQAIIFGLFHGYNSLGLIETITMGLVCGYFALKTNGIEVSSAVHSANNMGVGIFVMLGLHTSTSSPQLNTVLPGIIFMIVMAAILYYIGEKTEWFGEIQQNN